MSGDHSRGLHAEIRRTPQGSPGGGDWKRGAATVILGIAVIGGGIGLGAWWFYGHGQHIVQEGDLPVLMPEGGPVKVRPDNPGGMEVPHRDTTIYQELDDSGADVVVVIDPIPDMPRAPEAFELGPPPDARKLVGDEMEIDSGTDIDAPEIGEPAAASLKQAPAAAAKPAAPAPSQTATAPEQTPATAAPKPDASTDPASEGEFRIQMASFREQGQASVAWNKISSENKDVVGNLKMFVQKVDLGDKGIFYRLQAGPLDGRAAADKICSELKQRNVGCLSVRP
ncbi:SPOR domain-containing protein [Thalassospira marina]|uniref:Energy transducer TonB n=1 Tax=Thalassospira marina TaxID=2048283 RepID=A0ABM6Q8R6_9PROT|nr:SPOR domain-containing protein [Thalassospira marina]AUG52854.1 energy transducer TonB [Thalassospira marina]